MSATTATLEALEARKQGRALEALVKRQEARDRPQLLALGERIYREVELDQGRTWVEALRALTYRPDAEVAIYAYLSYRPFPVPFFGERKRP